MNVDPVTTEIVRASLVYASEEMGLAVRNAAYSPNIKERLDHSCALFDRHGRLIAQAEHIPVHLGSLPWGLRETLRALAQRGIAMRPGDMWVVNDPFVSGTHLNDITVVRPVFASAADDAPFGYAASKAHHADVGGGVPGSISADAPDLFAEGLVLPPLRLVAGDAVVEETVALVRANSRTPEARSGDLKAQMAGGFVGERRLLELVARHGRATFDAAVERSLADSEKRLRAALATFGSHDVDVADVMEPPDDGPLLSLRAHVSVRDGSLAVDFAGTSPQVPFALNAVFGVTYSGVCYAVRAATDPGVPMNDGCFRPIDVRAPLGSLLNPRRPAPVGGGNVETAQRIADVVLRAFAAFAPERFPAQSSGTMANVMCGGETSDGRTWAFYETNGGGMGARPQADGIDGIHTHMTNTLNTPIEAIERYFPIRITRYEFAEGTGGDGEFRGGCGLVRAFEVLDGTARVTLLAERARVLPEGRAGGGDGAPGRHALRRRGEEAVLPAKTSLALEPGDEIVVQTPGGGGYGDPRRRAGDARTADERAGLV